LSLPQKGWAQKRVVDEHTLAQRVGGAVVATAGIGKEQQFKRRVPGGNWFCSGKLAGQAQRPLPIAGRRNGQRERATEK
jgi:hypothetical protein